MKRAAALLATLLLAVPGAWANASERGMPRIVSLGPALTEQVRLLGADKALVGVTIYCSNPDRVPTVGTLMEPDLERIAALKPDYVLSTPMTTPRSLRALENLGIGVVRFELPESFQALCEDFLRLGSLLGCAPRAGGLVKEARARVAAVRARTGALPRPRVLVQIGTDPLYVATRRMFIHDLVGWAGGEHLCPSSGPGLISREEAVALRPDYILIATMGLSGEHETAAWRRFSSLPAAAPGRIAVLDSYEICSPTPERFCRTLETVARILHPEAFDGR